MIPTLPYKSKGWRTAKISPTCECIGERIEDGFIFCGEPTDYAYPASPSGWMTLCAKHGEKHMPHGAYKIEDVIASGEEFA